jgi:hypothetical protein
VSNLSTALWAHVSGYSSEQNRFRCSDSRVHTPLLLGEPEVDVSTGGHLHNGKENSRTSSARGDGVGLQLGFKGLQDRLAVAD